MIDGQFVVGLTGGVGAGKSTVAEAFEELGVYIVDTDVIAKELVNPGEPALDEIRKAFGDNILLSSGTLDRGYLRRLVFENPAKKKVLEAILHPAIRKRALELVRQAPTSSPYCLLVVPLLFETGFEQLTDRVLVVDIPERAQIERVAHRDQSDPALIERIIRSQLPREERLARADDVIDNSLGVEEIDKQIFPLHQQYLRLAETKIKAQH